MRKFKVLVSHHLARPVDLERIEAAVPGVQAVKGIYLDAVTQGWIDSHRNSTPGSEEAIDPQTFFDHAGDAEVIYGLRLPSDIADRAPQLKWVHMYGAGVDYVADTGILERGIKLSNSAGINAPPVAEFVLLYMLSHAKRFVPRIDDQRGRRWTPRVNGELRDAVLGIVGPGHIGQEVARRATAFGMRVLAARRSYSDGQTLPPIDELYPLSRLREMLARCDYVAVTIGLTDQTRHLIGPAEFASMKKGGFFMNVARGGVVDQAALVDALRSEHLGGAGLDVFDPEPLSADSPLWDLPNVVITPHNASGLPSHVERSTEFFCQNLRRYVDGQPLVNLISA